MKTINIKFPLDDDKETNAAFALNSTTKDALTSNLVLLLLTDKGQRYYEPDYGTHLRRYLFEPKDPITFGEVEEDIRVTVKTFIPQLTIKNINIFDNKSEEGDALMETEIRLLVDFIYDEGVFTDTGRLELTF